MEGGDVIRKQREGKGGMGDDDGKRKEGLMQGKDNLRKKRLMKKKKRENQ